MICPKTNRNITHNKKPYIYGIAVEIIVVRLFIEFR